MDHLLMQQERLMSLMYGASSLTYVIPCNPMSDRVNHRHAQRKSTHPCIARSTSWHRLWHIDSCCSSTENRVSLICSQSRCPSPAFWYNGPNSPTAVFSLKRSTRTVLTPYRSLQIISRSECKEDRYQHCISACNRSCFEIASRDSAPAPAPVFPRTDCQSDVEAGHGTHLVQIRWVRETMPTMG